MHDPSFQSVWTKVSAGLVGSILLGLLACGGGGDSSSAGNAGVGPVPVVEPTWGTFETLALPTPGGATTAHGEPASVAWSGGHGVVVASLTATPASGLAYPMVAGWRLAPGGAAWSAPVALSPLGVAASGTCVALDALGNGWCTWQQKDTAGIWQFWTAPISASTGFGTPRFISAVPGVHQASGAVTVDAQGHAWAAWTASFAPGPSGIQPSWGFLDVGEYWNTTPNPLDNVSVAKVYAPKFLLNDGQGTAALVLTFDVGDVPPELTGGLLAAGSTNLPQYLVPNGWSAQWYEPSSMVVEGIKTFSLIFRSINDMNTVRRVRLDAAGWGSWMVLPVTPTYLTELKHAFDASGQGWVIYTDDETSGLNLKALRLTPTGFGTTTIPLETGSGQVRNIALAVAKGGEAQAFWLQPPAGTPYAALLPGGIQWTRTKAGTWQPPVLLPGTAALTLVGAPVLAMAADGQAGLVAFSALRGQAPLLAVARFK